MALQILHQLESASGRLEKEAILKARATDQTFKEVCRLTLDPLTNFYIKKLPEPDASKGVIQPPEIIRLEHALQDLKSKLCSRLLRGHDARDHVAFLLGCLTEDDREVLRRVLGRNLKCGVSEATVEKIWPDLKLSYPCMLVSPLTEKTKVKFPCIVQTKMDGMRFNAHVTSGDAVFRSRNGKDLAFEGLPIEADFEKLPDGVYDGELLVANCDRKTGNGILTKFQKGTGTALVGRDIHAKVWDVIPVNDFADGVCSTGYIERFRILSGTLKATRPKTIILVQTWLEVMNMEEAQIIYKEQLAKGEEGVILKDPKGPWEDKRVKHQVKMKAELEADLRVTGFLPGSGKFEGKIGSLLVESADGQVKTAVGTGLSDEQRSLPFSEFEDKIVAVKYNALITDKKTGARSLFLPVLVEVREDKNVADTI
jgi:ATP-dependent DNA ligase